MIKIIFVCVIQVIIKVKVVNSREAIVISFHESNIRGNNSLGRNIFSDKRCAVLVNNIKTGSNGYYRIAFSVQKGFIRKNINASTKYYHKGVALVDYDLIRNTFSEIMQDSIEMLMSVYADTKDTIPSIYNNFNKISFMSFGHATVNNICLLLDMYTSFSGFSSGKEVLVDIAGNLMYNLEYNKRQELRYAIQARYEGSRNKLYIAIMGD